MVVFAANANAEGSVPVKINKAMVVNETGSGDAMLWFDEQDISAKPTTRWKTSGNTNCWPAGLVIDLGRDYLIESISLFDLQKAYRAEGGRLEIAVGKPFAWTTVASPAMENNSKWRVIAIGKRTRYLHLVKHATAMCNLEGEFPENCDVNIGEVIITGKPLGKAMKAKKPHGKRPKPVTMDRFIGMNSYIDTDERLYDAVGTVREYRPWRWNGVDDVSKPISWEPMKVGDGDKYYASTACRVFTVMCLTRHQSRFHHSVPIPTSPKPIASWPTTHSSLWQDMVPRMWQKSCCAQQNLRQRKADWDISDISRIGTSKTASGATPRAISLRICLPPSAVHPTTDTSLPWAKASE